MGINDDKRHYNNESKIYSATPPAFIPNPAPCPLPLKKKTREKK